MDAIRNWLAGPRPYAEGVALYQVHGTDPLLKKVFSEPHTEFKEAKLAKVLQALLDAPQGQEKAPERPATTIPRCVFIPKEFWENHIEGWGGLSASEQERKRAELYASLDTDLLNEGPARFIAKYPYFRVTPAVELPVSDNPEPFNVRLDFQPIVDSVTVTQDRPRRVTGWPEILDPALQPLHDEWKPLFAERMMLMATIYEIAKAGQTDTVKREEARVKALRILELRTRCIEIYELRDHYLEHGKFPEPAPANDIETNPRKWPKKLENHQRYLRDYRGKLAVAEKTEPRDEAKISAILANIRKQEGLIATYKKLMDGDAV